MAEQKVKRRWRFYKTASGNEVVKKDLDKLSDEHAAEVVAALKEVAREGLAAARHLRGDIYEVRTAVAGQAYPMLFCEEGEKSQVLLGLEFFEKKSQKTPKRQIDLAEKRLKEWRKRGDELRASDRRTPTPKASGAESTRYSHTEFDISPTESG